MKRLGVLGSGRGSNYRAIADAITRGEVDAEVALVVSDVPDAGILEIARGFGHPALYHPSGEFRTRMSPEAELALARRLSDAGVDLVVLAGFMRMVKAPLLGAFPRRIINIHPSLLPAFPGLRAWEQALEAGVAETGCSVHYVDAGMDTGEVIASRAVPVLGDDTPGSLHRRIQEAEHRLYPEAIRRVLGYLETGS